MNKTLIASAVAAALLLPAAAIAQTAAPAPAAEAAPTAPPPSPLTGNMTITSDYVFRGLTQTKSKPAIQGGLDYAHPSGLYVGTWLSNISWFTDQDAGNKILPISLASPGAVGAPYFPNRSNQASLEWDIYGGYKNAFAEDWNYDIGVLTYNYPGTYDNLGAYRKPNTTEVYGALGYKWLTLKYSKAISTYTFGVNESKGADYVDLSASIPLGDSGFTLLAHVGHQRYPGNANSGYWGPANVPGRGNNSYFSYTDYKLGVSKDFEGYTFMLAATGSNTKDSANDVLNGITTAYMNAFLKNIGKGTVAVSVTKTF